MIPRFRPRPSVPCGILEAEADSLPILRSSSTALCAAIAACMVVSGTPRARPTQGERTERRSATARQPSTRTPQGVILALLQPVEPRSAFTRRLINTLSSRHEHFPAPNLGWHVGSRWSPAISRCSHKAVSGLMRGRLQACALAVVLSCAACDGCLPDRGVRPLPSAFCPSLAPGTVVVLDRAMPGFLCAVMSRVPRGSLGRFTLARRCAALLLRGGGGGRDTRQGAARRGMGCCKMQEEGQFKRNPVVGVLGYLQLLPRGTGQRVLNAPAAGAESGEQLSGIAVAEALRKSITALYGEFVTVDGAGVDYSALRASEEFKAYVALASQLTRVDPLSMDRNERLAFFINVYNSLTIHAVAALGGPADLLSRLRLYAEASYQIGPHVYSLNDIENGVLRGNRGA